MTLSRKCRRCRTGPGGGVRADGRRLHGGPAPRRTSPGRHRAARQPPRHSTSLCTTSCPRRSRTRSRSSRSTPVPSRRTRSSGPTRPRSREPAVTSRWPSGRSSASRSSTRPSTGWPACCRACRPGASTSTSARWVTSPSASSRRPSSTGCKEYVVFAVQKGNPKQIDGLRPPADPDRRAGRPVRRRRSSRAVREVRERGQAGGRGPVLQGPADLDPRCAVQPCRRLLLLAGAADLLRRAVQGRARARRPGQVERVQRPVPGCRGAQGLAARRGPPRGIQDAARERHLRRDHAEMGPGRQQAGDAGINMGVE